ncbi:hypothetical protein M2323_003791 [Rhodoblastus acidophilus]|uniref:hypothetical protein n=1 Tax=Rhodoblastus acidophilus TaxID=1074 RepID=UPI00222563C3|nr:hypothetical protein [Rhodoblastus acidophilus]MCW2285954.1 hypothetical protein [Rhodoblastus acidophilus]MCW2334848.1 hypothetical protein [Rhodoblastus acidophilus]
MKSNLAFGLAVSAGLSLAGAAGAESLPADPALALVPKALSDDLQPVASSEIKAEARPSAAQCLGPQRQLRRVALMAGHARVEADRPAAPVRPVPPIFVIGVGY